MVDLRLKKPDELAEKVHGELPLNEQRVFSLLEAMKLFDLKPNQIRLLKGH